MYSSHYCIKDELITKFCQKHTVDREDIWACSRFTPYDRDSYCFEFYVGINTNDLDYDNYSHIPLYGDYLKFEWLGRQEDTYSRVKNIYDNLFINFGVSRKNGFDIERQFKIKDTEGLYVFSYYIPIAITIAIKKAVTT